MMASVISFFLFNKYGQWITLLAVIGIALAIFFYVHDKTIAERATEKFNQEQQALILKSQQELIKKTEELSKVQAEIAKSLDQNTADLKQKIDGFTAGNDNSTLPGKTDEVSPYLRDAIERLRKSR